MQINRVTAAAIIAAAVILGLLLLVPQLFPAQGSGDDGNAAASPGPPPSPDVTVTVPITPEISMEGSAVPGNFWAKADPVPDIHQGRIGNVTIRGTTNVPAGEVLVIDLYAESMHPSQMEYNWDLWVSTTAKVVSGNGGINKWSVDVRPEDFKKPDTWFILVNENGWSIGSGSFNVTA